MAAKPPRPQVREHAESGAGGFGSVGDPSNHPSGQKILPRQAPRRIIGDDAMHAVLAAIARERAKLAMLDPESPRVRPTVPVLAFMRAEIDGAP